MDDEDEDYGRFRLLRHINKRHLIIFVCCFFILNTNMIRELTIITLPLWSSARNTKGLSNLRSCNLSNPFKHMAFELTPNILYTFEKNPRTNMQIAYYVGAASTKLIGGIIADKYGSRKILLFYGIAALVSIIFYPTFIQYSQGKHLLIYGWQAVTGMISGLVSPTVNSVTAHWTPKYRRTTTICFVNVTFSISGLLSHSLMKYIIYKTNYWPTVYYVMGCMLLINSTLWYIFGHSCAESHPFISNREKRFLHKELGRSLLPFKKKKIPWTKIFTSIPFWASYFNHLGRGWAFFNTYIYMPMYLRTVLKTALGHNLIMGMTIPFSLMGVSDLCSGLFCDYLVNKNIMDITTTRKIFSNFGAVGVGVFTVTSSMTGCNQLLGYALFCIIIIHLGAYNTGVGANDIDLSVNFAGILKGINDTSEHLLTLLLPILLQSMIKDHSVNGWRYTFLVLFAVVMVTNVFFTIAGRAREQSWNLPYNKKI